MTTQKCTDKIATEWAKEKERLNAMTDTEIREYPLCFDYVEANTFGEHEAYHRFQMSWGGPSDEVRFYELKKGYVYRVTYAFLDWYDSAEIDITNEPVVDKLRMALPDHEVY